MGALFKKCIASVSAIAILAGLHGAYAKGGTAFPDVGPTDWYYEPVMSLSGSGVISGYEDGTFRPDGKLTGGAFIKLVAYCAFPDKVTENQQFWWKGSYDAAARLGVIDSTLLSTQDMNEPITRNQVARILANTLTVTLGERVAVPEGMTGYIKDSYAIPAAYVEGVYTAFAAGLVGGYDDGCFRGENTLTRAEAATMLYRLANKSKRLKLDTSKLSTTVTDEWFSDAALIGDSLTHGLDLYGKLDTPDYYHYTGASVYSILGCSFDTAGGELAFTDALSGKSYGKVYILLGINEMGGNPDSYYTQYAKVIDQVRVLQPDAVIYLQTVLPVSREKEANSTSFTKANVQSYNEKIKQLAADKGCKLVDTYSALADSEGYLPEEQTWDGVHLNTAYYIKWADYLRSHT